MAQKDLFSKIKLSKVHLWLAAILLLFVLLLIIIWLWYSLELNKIDKELKPVKISVITISSFNRQANQLKINTSVNSSLPAVVKSNSLTPNKIKTWKTM